MKAFVSSIAIAVVTFVCSPSAIAQLYWDLDGTIDGAGGTAPSGMWDASTTNWNSDPSGGAFGVITTWDNTAATFSAGSDAAGVYTITVDGTQSVSGIIFDSGSATLSGGTLSLTGAPTTIQVDDSAVGTINSELQGAGLTKTGSGTLALNGANASFTGTMTVSNGILSIPSGAPATVLGNIGTLGQSATAANNTVVSSGASVQITGTYNGTDQFLIRGDGYNGGGALRKVGADETVYLGPKGVTLNGGSARITSADVGGTLVFRNGNFGRNTTTGPPTLTFDGAGDIRTTAAADGGNWNMAIGSSRVVKEGTGTLTLGGASSWTGGTTIKGGVISFNADPTSGSAQLGTVPTTLDPTNVIIDGGTLRNTTTTTGFFRFARTNRGIQLGPNGGTIDIVTANVNPEYDGVIGMTAGTTEATLTKIGAGEFRMQGTGTFTKLVVNNGLYRIGNAGSDLGLGAVPASFKTDAIVLDGGAIGSSVGLTLDANRGITLGGNGGSFNASAASMVVPGAITGAGKLKKETAGTLTLQGANDYSGGTNVSAGTLVVSTAPATLGTGNVTISGGTLQISGGVTNAFADTAALSMTGGILNLGAGIDDTIASLTLGGMLQIGGTYGSTSSPATFKNDTYFSGSGILTIPGGSLPGDYNLDNKVDAADYVLWRKNPNAHGGDPQGYITWRENFGNPAGAGSGSELAGGGSVPEPAAVVLMLLGVAGAVMGRRWRP
jgi:autotransporter-associated beta strand protein